MHFDPMTDPSRHPDSYWAATAMEPPTIPSFDGKVFADVGVIGSGFTGLSTALHCAERGLSVVVLDANEPGWGASGRNNGQVVAGLKHEPYEIERKYGKERGNRLIDAIGAGPDVVFGLIEKHGIACTATRNGILTAAHCDRAQTALQRRTDIWNARGVPLRMLDRQETEEKIGTTFYQAANFDPRGGSINPLGYARGLASAALKAGARIYKDAHVEKLSPDNGHWRVVTGSGIATVGKVVIGTNGYTDDLWPGLKCSVLPVRTPQLVSKPIGHNLAKTILPGRQTMSDTRSLTIGVRMHPDGRYHIAGGGGSTRGEIEKPFENLRQLTKILFPELSGIEWDYMWTGWMAMTPDRFPQLFELAPGVMAVLGYSGRGIAMSTLIGCEFAAWAKGEAAADDLAIPSSSFRTLPYYMLKDIIIAGAVQYYRAKDALDRQRA